MKQLEAGRLEAVKQMPVDLLVSWSDGAVKRAIADANCPEVGGLNV
jgi:hypothetical protein